MHYDREHMPINYTTIILPHILAYDINPYIKHFQALDNHFCGIAEALLTEMDNKTIGTNFPEELWGEYCKEATYAMQLNPAAITYTGALLRWAATAFNILHYPSCLLHGKESAWDFYRHLIQFPPHIMWATLFISVDHNTMTPTDYDTWLTSHRYGLRGMQSIAEMN